MKRSIALLISAGVTAVVLVAVLAVTAPKIDSASAVQPAVPNTLASDDPETLRQQLQATQALLQQREAAYQQRLQEAYAQLQAAQGSGAGSFEGEDGDEHEGDREGGEHEFSGVVEGTLGDVWTIAGQAVQVTPKTKVERVINVGDRVKVHARRQADGSLLAREIERKHD